MSLMQYLTCVKRSDESDIGHSRDKRRDKPIVLARPRLLTRTYCNNVQSRVIYCRLHHVVPLAAGTSGHVVTCPVTLQTVPLAIKRHEYSHGEVTISGDGSDKLRTAE